MTDKEKILAEIERLEKENCMNNGEHFCMRRALCLGRLRDIISPMMEEHASDDLEEAIGEYCSSPENFITYIDVGFKQSPIKKDDIPLIIKAIEFGANWQKEHLWKPADGDDLPEIGKEVIVLIKDSVQRNIHAKEYLIYRIGFGHRPNPDGWDGKNIDTDKVTHYTPKLYDKGGWNAPNIAYWLDIELPKEIEL